MLQSERDFLNATHVTALQAAARLAGLRWKSGALGFDKAGIIAKLDSFPAIARATIASALSSGSLFYS